MPMRSCVVAWACLACLCFGRRSQTPQKALSREQDLATMLLSTQPALALPRSTRSVAPRMGQAGDIRGGMQLELDGVLYKCIEFQHTKTARQAGMIRTKLKNLISGATIEKTFRLTETYKEATLDKIDMSFSYIDGMDHVFMNMDTYEEARVLSSNLDNFDFVKEGTIVEVVWWNDKAVEVNIPKKVILTVSDGTSNTGAGKKEVIVETGARVKDVPEYIQTGDEIWINTDTGKFLERVK